MGKTNALLLILFSGISFAQQNPCRIENFNIFGIGLPEKLDSILEYQEDGTLRKRIIHRYGSDGIQATEYGGIVFSASGNTWRVDTSSYSRTGDVIVESFPSAGGTNRIHLNIEHGVDSIVEQEATSGLRRQHIQMTTGMKVIRDYRGTRLAHADSFAYAGSGMTHFVKYYGSNGTVSEQYIIPWTASGDTCSEDGEPYFFVNRGGRYDFVRSDGRRTHWYWSATTGASIRKVWKQPSRIRVRREAYSTDGKRLGPRRNRHLFELPPKP